MGVDINIRISGARGALGQSLDVGGVSVPADPGAGGPGAVTDSLKVPLAGATFPMGAAPNAVEERGMERDLRDGHTRVFPGAKLWSSNQGGALTAGNAELDMELDRRRGQGAKIGAMDCRVVVDSAQGIDNGSGPQVKIIEGEVVCSPK